MTFVKTIKTKAYFKRYQVKLRRRREGKTDYMARKKLIHQDKNKYNAKKYRFVVRISNKKVLCQVVYATQIGDHVVCAADSSELNNYGIPVGHTNYSAAYATGLLLARRLLKQYDMDKSFTGVEKATGEEFHIEEEYDGDRRPFKCLLDVGIIRTTTGNSVFGAMKGACDGGLHIPHSNKKFFGYSKDGYDAEAHRGRIMGTHVSAYMKMMKEEDEEKYSQHFSQYIKHNINPEDIEEMYENAHKQIRENPEKIKSNKTQYKPTRTNHVVKSDNHTYIRYKKINKEQRRERVQQKLLKIQEMVA